MNAHQSWFSSLTHTRSSQGFHLKKSKKKKKKTGLVINPLICTNTSDV